MFLTGHLAHGRLERVLQGMAPTAFDWSILNVGVKVAALMTEPILIRRLPRPLDADRVVVPGRCRADLARLAQEFGPPFQRGPDELKDLPAFFGRTGVALDLSRHALRIFAEIVDASQFSLEAIVARAEALRAAGADVIDLGCLPDTPFPHLEETVRELKARGLAVSVDSADPERVASRRRGRRRLPAQPHRAQSRDRRRDRRAAGADPRRSTAICRRSFAPPRRRIKAGIARHSRSCSRSHSFRLR